MWKSFPRDLEQRVNHLLDEAVPNATKAFQLYKSCQAENLWSESFEKFSAHLNEFCSVPRIDRSKGQFDRWLNRPMDSVTYENFHLTFRTAQIEPTEIRNIASWAHHLMRFNMRVEPEAISIATLEKTLIRLTSPTSYDKEADIEFADFCDTWKSTVSPLLDSEQRVQLNGLLEDLRKLDIHSKNLQEQVDKRTIDQTQIYLTQTELDWALAVRRTAFTYGAMPKYPLKRGPEKKDLIDLQKLVTLYNLVQITDHIDLVKHRENIRLTILDRCDLLLKDQAA